PSILFTSNNFLLAIAKAREESPEHDLSSLRTLIPTGAAMSRDAEELVQRVTGCRVQQIYGMTEVGVVLGLTKHNAPHKTGSVGKLCPFVQCKVVDPETELAVGVGQEGELRFKGPGVTKGYLRNPRATAELFDEGGWLRSGDLARFDEDGIFFVTGRIKDTIKYRGVHVSPVEIEGLLDRHDAVLESAVVGVLDPSTEDELPRAYVVLRPGAQVTAQDLCQVVEDHLAPHKWLRGGVAFVDSLPKTPTGKISRAAIRKRYLENVTIGS
ncbi:Luciferin 4-monooxygenase, partial [Gryllus bimaculatus]